MVTLVIFIVSVNFPSGLIPSEQEQFEEEKKLSKFTTNLIISSYVIF